MNLFVSSAPLKPSREAKKVKKFTDKISGVILSYLRTNIPNLVRQSVSFTFFELAITFGIFILPCPRLSRRRVLSNFGTQADINQGQGQHLNILEL